MKTKTWWAILKDSKGWEKRLKVPVGFYTRVYRYPVKTKSNTIYNFGSEGSVMIPQTDLQTKDFEYEGKQETDTAVYTYYYERV